MHYSYKSGDLYRISYQNFYLEFSKEDSKLIVHSSDGRKILYQYENENLISVESPTKYDQSYTYDLEGNLINPKWNQKYSYNESGQVVAFSQIDGETIIFSYNANQTDVITETHKTSYQFDNFNRVQSIDIHAPDESIYLSYLISWTDEGKLLSKSIFDPIFGIRTHKAITYDINGNISTETTYGNLTGESEKPIDLNSLSETESYKKTFHYAKNGLLLHQDDGKEGGTFYQYLLGTNLISSKIVKTGSKIHERFFFTYNELGICIESSNDDSRDKIRGEVNNINTRMSTRTYPNEKGLSERVERFGWDNESKQKTLLQIQINEYDAFGRVIKQEVYNGNSNLLHETKLSYDHKSRLSALDDSVHGITLQEFDQWGHISKKEHLSQSRVIEYKYSATNQITSQKEIRGGEAKTLYFKYNKKGNLVQKTDEHLNATTYTYDFLGRCLSVQEPEIKFEDGSAQRPTYEYEYNVLGKLIRATDPLGYETTRDYNLYGSPSRVEYPDGSFELFKYDLEGSLHRKFSRDERISVYEYDAFGRMWHEEESTKGRTSTGQWIQSKRYKYDSFHMTKYKSGHETFFTYDGSGNTTSEYDENAKKEFAHDPKGRVTEQKIWYGDHEDEYALHQFSYDKKGQVVEKCILSSDGSLLHKRSYTYNPYGKLLKEKAGNNTIYQCKYDFWNRPLEITDAEGIVTTFVYEEVVNDLGQMVQQIIKIDTLGNQAFSQFDAHEHISSITQKSPFEETLLEEKRFYDLADHLIAKIYTFQDISHSYRWEYGPLDQLRKSVEVGTDGQERITQFTYNKKGQLLEKFLPGKSSPVTYQYNKEGRLYKVFYDSRDSLRFSYSDQGKITSAYAPQTGASKVYDKTGRIKKEVFKEGGGTYSILYERDRMGRITSITLPDRSQIRYEYDALFGRKIQRISPEKTLLYEHLYLEYDYLGRCIKEKTICGVQYNEYSGNGKLKSIQTNFSTETSKRNALSQITDTNQRQFLYNAQNQLVSDGNDYSYSFLDRRLSKNKNNYTYGPFGNVLHAEGRKYSYNSQGLISSIDDLKITTNSLGQITNKKQGRNRCSTKYGPFGRLLSESGYVKKPINRRYLWVGNIEIGSLDRNDKVLDLRIPGISGGKLSNKAAFFEIEGKAYLPLRDIIGNITALVDPSQKQIIESYTYDAFAETNPKNTPISPWRYQEKRTGPFGFVHYFARHYDPKIGRWLTPDPKAPIDGPDPYAFVRNDPINNCDPLGYTTQERTEIHDYFYGEVEPHCYCEKHRTCKTAGYHPSGNGEVTFCDYFEDLYTKYNNYYSHTVEDEDSYSSFELIPGKSGYGAIGYMNGIQNKYLEAKESAIYISKLAGGAEIHFIYNATHGFIEDLGECIMGLFGYATPPIRELHKAWSAFFAAHPPPEKFLQICHSQGAIHVRNALLSYDPDLRKRIDVLAIAPGAYIQDTLCNNVEHYCSTWDFIPWLDRKGRQMCKNSIHELKPHPSASLFDHSFHSLTYRDTLKMEIDKHLRPSPEFLQCY